MSINILSRGYAFEIFRGIASKKRMSGSIRKAIGFPHGAAAEPPLTKILPTASFQSLVNVLYNSKVEARPLRVDESENRESSLKTRSKGKVAEARARVFRPGELVAVAKSAGLSLRVAQT